MTETSGNTGNTGNAESNPLSYTKKTNAAPVAHTGQRVGNMGNTRLDFAAINAAALRALPDLLARWLSDGRAEGQEWVARNPCRADHTPGSFKVNIRTGKWCDFATGDKGGDAVSLAAYLFGLRQIEAGRWLADMLGLPCEGGA